MRDIKRKDVFVSFNFGEVTFSARSVYISDWGNRSDHILTQSEESRSNREGLRLSARFLLRPFSALRRLSASVSDLGASSVVRLSPLLLEGW